MAGNNPPPLPVMLQLAPLPRTQIGPYLILGVDKDADKETIESRVLLESFARATVDPWQVDLDA